MNNSFSPLIGIRLPLAIVFIIATFEISAETFNLKSPVFWKKSEDICLSNQLKEPLNAKVSKQTLQKYCSCVTDQLKTRTTESTWENKDQFKIIANDAAKICIQKMSPKASKDRVEEELVSISINRNKSLPYLLNQYISQDGTTAGPGRRFSNFYSFTETKAKDVNLEDFNSTTRPAMRNIYCTEPSYEYFRSNKVTMNYSFTDSEGIFVTRFDVKPDECNR